MATSTQPKVLKLILAKIRGLSLTVSGEPVNVYDGPQGPANDDNMVVVMGWPGQDSSSGQEEVAYIGVPLTRYERYDLAIVVSCYIGGDDAAGISGPSDAQATARTNAEALQAAIETAMLADPKLATQNGGTAPVIWCLLQDWNWDQTDPSEDDTAMGRYSTVAMRYQVYNVLGWA